MVSEKGLNYCIAKFKITLDFALVCSAFASSSLQFKIVYMCVSYVLRKAHDISFVLRKTHNVIRYIYIDIYIYSTSAHLSVQSFPSGAFETLLVLVGLPLSWPFLILLRKIIKPSSLNNNKYC